MSGVLIRGMEMPNCCNDCPFCDYETACCLASNDTPTGSSRYETREQWCPLVPVPPHGRLIDADAFEKKNAYFWGRDFINAKYEDCLCDLVNDAPTIIPASEEGEA